MRRAMASPEHAPLDTGLPHHIDSQDEEDLFGPREADPLRVRLFSMAPHQLAAPVSLVSAPSPIPMSALLATHSYISENMHTTPSMPVDRKGKAVSRPIRIHGRAVMASPMTADSDEVFSMSPDEPSAPIHQASLTKAGNTTQFEDAFDFFSYQPSTLRSEEIAMFFENSQPGSPAAEDAEQQDGGGSSSYIGKGKARDVGPPTLPPLSFTPMEVGYGRIAWPSPGTSSFAGPSSYTSIASSSGAEHFRTTTPSPPITAVSLNSAAHAVMSPPSSPTTAASPPLSRSSSMRSLSTKIKVKLGAPKSPTTLAKKLLLRKRDGRDTPSAESAEETDAATSLTIGASYNRSSQLNSTPSSPSSPIFDLEVGPFVPNYPPTSIGLRSSRDSYLIKGKTRSNSSPYPLTGSVLDMVPQPASNLFVPVKPAPPSFFDEFLPHEIKIRILAALITVHEDDHQRAIDEGNWTMFKASSSKNRYVGKDKGVRELVRLGRVSRSWLGLTRDGQLWAKLNLRSFPRVSGPSLLHIADLAGSFIQHLDFTGQTHLSSTTLQSLADHLCLSSSLPPDLSSTQLTHINLRGCAAVTTRALHHLLIRSPCLEHLCAKGLSAVTNTTFDVLAVYCPRLRALDVGRCRNIDGSGLRSLASAALDRGEHLALTELRVSGLLYVTSDLMGVLGKAAPHLEVLDMSSCRGLHNSGLRAFVASSAADRAVDNVGVAMLTSREAGYDPADPTKYYRRVTRLRHLSLSSCGGITDGACKSLAHAVPRLEFLELAGIGPALRDEGVVHLLKTTPHIRRVDLEDASSITDGLLATLTPSTHKRGDPRPAEPGLALEYLCVSYATSVTDDALTRLINGCSRLRVLEVDNTRMSGRVLQDFVRAARRRGTADALLAAGDNRNVGESSVRDLAALTRPRLGWRAHDARRLAFLDVRDGEGLEGVGQDELDPLRVVVKTFYSWQTVDAVRAARKKRLRGRRPSWDEQEGEGASGASRTRWWSPGGRRASTGTAPTLLDAREGEACVIM